DRGRARAGEERAVSGPKHTPLDQLVEDALDEYSSGAYEKFSDARRALQSITREAYELGRRDAAPRLVEALERLLGLVDELHPNGFPEGFWPYEAVAAARAALREAGVS